jgi:hypothetical protein
VNRLGGRPADNRGLTHRLQFGRVSNATWQPSEPDQVTRELIHPVGLALIAHAIRPCSWVFELTNKRENMFARPGLSSQSNMRSLGGFAASHQLMDERLGSAEMMLSHFAG